MKLADMLDQLNLSDKTIKAHGRFIHSLYQLSISPKQLSHRQVTHSLNQLARRSTDTNVRHHIKRALQQWNKVQRWQTRYQNRPQLLIKRLFKTTASFPVIVRYTPLAVVIQLDEQDYFYCLKDNTSYGMTIEDESVPIIIIHAGGYCFDNRSKRAVHRTLRHELHHAIFDRYYDQASYSFPSIEVLSASPSSNGLTHRTQAEQINLQVSEISRSELFAYASNGTSEYDATALGHSSWLRKLRRLNVALLNNTKLKPGERKQYYSLYLQQYHHYLTNLYSYQCLVRWLLRYAKHQAMAIVVLTPLIRVVTLTLPNYPSILRDELMRWQHNRSVYYQTQPLAWRIQQLTKRNPKPTPEQLFRIVKLLPKTDPDTWEWLSQSLVTPGISTPRSLGLLSYIIQYCPNEDVTYTTILLLQVLIQDNVITGRNLTRAKRIIKERLNDVASRRPVHRMLSYLDKDIDRLFKS